MMVIRGGFSTERLFMALVAAAALTALGISPAAPSYRYADDHFSPSAMRAVVVSLLPDPQPVSVTGPRVGTALVHQHKTAQTITKMSPTDQQCLGAALYYEARGEPRAGQMAVAEVVVRRAHTAGYPRSVCGVVYQGNPGGATNCQFTWACNGDMNKRREDGAWRDAQRLATRIGTGKVALGDTTNHALFFHAVSVAPYWPGYMRTTQIGHHIFYRRTPGYRAPRIYRAAARRDDDGARPSTVYLAPADSGLPPAAAPETPHTPLNVQVPLTPVASSDGA